MTKRVLCYVAAIITTLSLQSCVTNYVVSNPKGQDVLYKSNAKISSLDKDKLDSAKKQLSSNFANAAGEKQAYMASMDRAVTAEEIARTIRFSKTIDGILNEAETYLGTPYRYGGMTRNGIDCSAFVLSVFGATVGMNLPRIAADQAQEGESIDRTQLQKGDLIFFAHSRRISHVGIVYNVNENGEVEFIHAATSKGVTVSNLSDKYWAPKYRFAKRVLNSEFVENYAHNNK